jgi:hypothetical protein
MDPKPILMFPVPTKTDRKKQKTFSGKVHYPTIDRQQKRIEPIFTELQKAFETQRIELQNDPCCTEPEKVLVLEIIGSIEKFISAVKRIEGMEWLGEWGEEDIPPDHDFYFADKDRKDKPLVGRLFLVLSNQRALEELLSLWKRYLKDPKAKFDRGLNKWRDLFSQVKDIRTWGVKDRLLETGVLDDWNERVKAGEKNIRFEIELWFRSDTEGRLRAKTDLEHVLKIDGGRILGQTVISEIAYHAVLAELPAQTIKAILKQKQTRLVHNNQVMFFRPVGQMAVTLPNDDPQAGVSLDTDRLPEGEPIIAVFDGLPLENHSLLKGRLIVDDPDGWSSEYPANERFHGTAMTSLVIHGELDARYTPLKRPVYIRPILKPDDSSWVSPRRETMPPDTLPVDIVHRAVRRLFEVDGLESPVAPQIRIINLSIADPSRLFDYFLSPWARLLDWLAWRYKVLFIVSAGNHSQEIVLNLPRTSASSLDTNVLEQETLKAIALDARNRRLLSPAESINSVTVGAMQYDFSTSTNLGFRSNPYCSTGLPSPINALGLGYRRAIKPEILLPGGRQLYVDKLGTTHVNITLCVNDSSIAPGQRTATPGKKPGDLNATRYIRGTSNAAALATHISGELYEMLQLLREEPGGEMLEEGFLAVLIKALLVHGASWGEIYNTLETVLKNPVNRSRFKEYVSRFLGYGTVDISHIMNCTDQRATLLGCGIIQEGAAHIYSIPLPPSLSGQKEWRRLTITLAWLTPISPSNRLYRQAFLWFEPPLDKLQVSREEADWKAVRRGTVQHEILEGSRATAFVDGDGLQIQVNCREDASKLLDSIPYAIAASLEVAEGVSIPVYDEIRARVRPGIPITPTTI